mmetsp:Transcript_88592/g.236831  ORF Transcript_88592/g.236831 Transcript_88592/m.236831 type:complete len:247 (+) Transcript_88592:2799-3539(+)
MSLLTRLLLRATLRRHADIHIGSVVHRHHVGCVLTPEAVPTVQHIPLGDRGAVVFQSDPRVVLTCCSAIPLGLVRTAADGGLLNASRGVGVVTKHLVLLRSEPFLAVAGGKHELIVIHVVVPDGPCLRCRIIRLVAIHSGTDQIVRCRVPRQPGWNMAYPHPPVLPTPHFLALALGPLALLRQLHPHVRTVVDRQDVSGVGASESVATVHDAAVARGIAVVLHGNPRVMLAGGPSVPSCLVRPFTD